MERKHQYNLWHAVLAIFAVLPAATNRPEVLDPVHLRAGRFDRQVLVDMPDRRGRAQILRVHIKKAKIAKDVDADQVAALTTGFTGADLANLVNEAALLPTRRKARQVEMQDFTNAIERSARALLERETLEVEELRKLTEGLKRERTEAPTKAGKQATAAE